MEEFTYPEGITVLINLWSSKEESKKLQDSKILGEFLITLVNKLKMTPLRDTLILKEIPALGHEGMTSVTATIALLESHVCFHSWPEWNYMRLEISTCREADVDSYSDSINYIKEFFQCARLDIKYKMWRDKDIDM